MWKLEKVGRTMDVVLEDCGLVDGREVASKGVSWARRVF